VRVAAVVGSLWLSTAALAQATDSGALIRQQQQNAPPERSGTKPSAAPPPLEVRKPAPEPQQASAGGRIFVKHFRLSTASTLVSEAELNALLRDFLERENTIEDLRKASEQVSNHLRQRGYAFARAIVPQQEIVDGIVVVEIAQGKLSKEADGQPSINLKADGKTRLDPGRAKAMLAAAASDPEGLNIQGIERGLLLLNDLPGILGTGIVVPGREPGTAGLTVDVREGPLVGGWLGLDNFGSRTTGTNRGSEEVNLNNPSGSGDLAKLNLAKSSGTESATISYLMPIGVSGLRARFAASGMHYHVLESFSVTGSKGSSNLLSAGVSYPKLRTQTASMYLTGTVDSKQFKDSLADVQISARRAQSLSVGAQGNHQYSASGRLLSYTATLTRGNLDRSAVPSDLAADEATRRTQGSYGVLRATGVWQEQISTNSAVSATYAMQLASKNLDSSEKIYLGGPRGVRAYPIEEAGSDAGHILNLEARWRLAQVTKRGSQEWTLFGFFDAGRAVLNKNTWDGWNSGNPNLRNDYTLKGWGLGMRAYIAETVQIELVGARKIGGNPGASATGLDANGRSDKTRLWLVGTIFF
jgi:hemolysin activation/secretion protein